MLSRNPQPSEDCQCHRNLRVVWFQLVSIWDWIWFVNAGVEQLVWRFSASFVSEDRSDCLARALFELHLSEKKEVRWVLITQPDSTSIRLQVFVLSMAIYFYFVYFSFYLFHHFGISDVSLTKNKKRTSPFFRLAGAEPTSGVRLSAPNLLLTSAIYVSFSRFLFPFRLDTSTYSACSSGCLLDCKIFWKKQDCEKILFTD